VILQYYVERFKLWESKDNMQHSDRFDVRVTQHIGLHTINSDESLSVSVFLP